MVVPVGEKLEGFALPDFLETDGALLLFFGNTHFKVSLYGVSHKRSPTVRPFARGHVGNRVF